MSAIVSWEYYSSLHNKVTQTEFPVAAGNAQNEVRLVIGPIKFDKITDTTYGYDQLKECICNVIDLKVEHAKREARIGVSSASNDGYSENYNNSGDTLGNISDETKSMIKKWLSGTGLVGAY